MTDELPIDDINAAVVGGTLALEDFIALRFGSDAHDPVFRAKLKVVVAGICIETARSVAHSYILASARQAEESSRNMYRAVLAGAEIQRRRGS